MKFQGLSISALPLPTVKLRVQVAEDPSFGPGPFITVTEGRTAHPHPAATAGAGRQLADLTLEEPRIHVVEDAAGRLNVATLGGGAPPAPTGPPRVGTSRPGVAAASAVVLSRVRIVKGAIDYQKAGAKSAQFTVDAIDVTVTRAAAGKRSGSAGARRPSPAT